MPLDTYAAPDVRQLFAEVENRLGPDAIVLHVKRVRQRDGSEFYEMLAGDPDSVDRNPRRRYLTVGNSAEVSGFAPKVEQVKAERDSRPAIVALVGPTGVGKTTTLAKLATHPHIFGGRYVGLLSLDMYRIGAEEQLRNYAEIACLPMQVAHTAGEAAGALRRLESREVVLVDTPGWGPKNSETRDATLQMLAELRPDEVHLALPATMPRALIIRSLTLYADCGVTHLLPTKADEWPERSDVFDIAVHRRVPMRWVTDGQEVPMDIRSARPRLLAGFGQSVRGARTPVAC